MGVQVIACACLFLAGKIEETPKALTDILKVVSGVRFAKQPRELEHVMVPILPASCPASKPFAAASHLAHVQPVHDAFLSARRTEVQTLLASTGLLSF